MAATTTTTDIFDRICASREEASRATQAEVSLEALRTCVADIWPRCGDLVSVIDEAGFVVAAEFKRASPSKGDIAWPGPAVPDQVARYTAGGASIISVLTEPRWFKGSLDDLHAARTFVSSLPTADKSRPLILRKDFVVDDYMVLEARHHGADTVLLIVAYLGTAARVAALLATARSVGMEPIVEVASMAELDVAVEAGARVIGVNNRDLRTFRLDPDLTARIASEALRRGLCSGPARVRFLAFSGISSPAQVTELHRLAGSAVSGILVGEHLMRATDPTQEIRLLRSAWASTTDSDDGSPMAKVCGVCSVEDALHAARAGASFVGLILVPESPRAVSVDEAASIVRAVRAFRESDPRPALEKLLPSAGEAAISAAAPLGAGAAGAAGAAAAATAALALSSSADGLVSSKLGARVAGLRRAAVRTHPLIVGVVRNMTPTQVARLAEQSGIDLVQLHGSESPWETEGDGWARCPKPLIKVLPVPPPTTDSVVRAALLDKLAVDVVSWDSLAAAILLDTKVGTHSGGTGEAFDWTVGAELRSRTGVPIAIAGGLRAETAPQALANSQAWLLDASSALEARPRIKDPLAVTAFVSATRAYSSKPGAAIAALMRPAAEAHAAALGPMPSVIEDYRESDPRLARQPLLAAAPSNVEDEAIHEADLSSSPEPAGLPTTDSLPRPTVVASALAAEELPSSWSAAEQRVLSLPVQLLQRIEHWSHWSDPRESTAALVGLIACALSLSWFGAWGLAWWTLAGATVFVGVVQASLRLARMASERGWVPLTTITTIESQLAGYLSEVASSLARGVDSLLIEELMIGMVQLVLRGAKALWTAITWSRPDRSIRLLATLLAFVPVVLPLVIWLATSPLIVGILGCLVLGRGLYWHAVGPQFDRMLTAIAPTVDRIPTGVRRMVVWIVSDEPWRLKSD